MAQTTNRAFKTVVLQPGESFTVPPDAEIIFVSDSVGLESQCELPETEDYVCYRVSFGISDTSGTDAALEDEGSPHPTIDYIEISGTQYPLDYDLNTAQVTSIVTAFEAAISPVIFSIYSVYKNNFSRRREFGIKFRTFPSLVDTIEIKITGVSYPDGLFLHATLDTDCDCYDNVDDLYCNNSNT